VQRLRCGEWILPKNYKAPLVAVTLRRLIGDLEMNTACKAVSAKFEAVSALEKTCDLLIQVQVDGLLKDLSHPETTRILSDT
jgi:hypothetical protein